MAPAVCILNPLNGTHNCRPGGGLRWVRSPTAAHRSKHALARSSKLHYWATPEGANSDVLLSFIRCRVVAAQQPNDPVEMKNMPLADLPSGQTIQATSDETLMKFLCQLRLVLPFTMNGSRYVQIECIAPAKKITTAAQWSCLIIVCIFKPEPWLTATMAGGGCVR
jgi:hypothetical protein